MREPASDDAEGVDELAWMVLEDKVVGLRDGSPAGPASEQDSDQPWMDNHRPRTLCVSAALLCSQGVVSEVQARE